MQLFCHHYRHSYCNAIQLWKQQPMQFVGPLLLRYIDTSIVLLDTNGSACQYECAVTRSKSTFTQLLCDCAVNRPRGPPLHA